MRFPLFAKSSISKGSNNNVVIQNSEITNNVFYGTTPESISTLGKLGNYNLIQEQVASVLSAAKLSHPLYPDFSASFNTKLNKLISSPETDEAIKKYPKNIKSCIKIDYSKYPNIDSSETIWEYAYRTQTKIEAETIEYKEYLGDIEDPFPIEEYSEGMITVISPPSFPSAVEATVQSGEISIPIVIRRKPNLVFGQTIIGTIIDKSNLDIEIIAYEEFKKTTITFNKVDTNTLEEQLQVERLIDTIRKTKKLAIYIGSSVLLECKFSKDDLDQFVFLFAPYMIRYINNLITIEKYTSCKFNPRLNDFSNEEYRLAIIIARSLESKWSSEKLTFDNKIRCDYEHIASDIGNCNPPYDCRIEGDVKKISIQDQQFQAERYMIIYRDACINNIKSVVKNVKKKKNNILITFKPQTGKTHFFKYYLLTGVQVITKSE